MQQRLNHETEIALRSIRGVVLRTWFGIFSERFLRAFWPAYTLIFFGFAFVLMGGLDMVPAWAFGVLIAFAVAVLAFLWIGLRRFRLPERATVITKIDATVNGAPIAALIDSQGTGTGDRASVALWRAHRDQMQARVGTAVAVPGDLRLSAFDRLGLRYVAVIAVLVAILFGSTSHLRNVPLVLAGETTVRIAATWEGWVVPPRHTAVPRMYLADVEEGELQVPEGSEITLRLYGETGALTVDHTLTEVGDVLRVDQSGILSINGRNGSEWRVVAISDQIPSIRVLGDAEHSAGGEFRQDFAVHDDYGAVSGEAQFGLNLAAIARVYGFSVAPDPRDDIVVDLPLTVTGGRGDFQETLVEQFELHPWAGLPVIVQMSVADAVGQIGAATPFETHLAERAFYDPVAQAVIEMRRDVLWARENAPRVAQILRALTHRPNDDVGGSDTYLGLRQVIRSLESEVPLTQTTQIEVAQSLWDIARQYEDGDLADAREELARAQNRLEEAIRQGAPEEEIARLNQELRRAMENYMRQAAREQQDTDQADAGETGEGTTVTQQDIDDLMARVEELLKEGRTEDALALLDALREMMENMQVTQGEGGDRSGDAMQGLSDTLRDQQELSDDAFRELQEQFDNNGTSDQGELADRQQALRDELNRLERALPNEDGGDALGQAGEAMDRAEQALRDNDLAGAIDGQAEAIERLREGMRGLAQAEADERSGEDQGQAGRSDDPNARDPLGREQGPTGAIGSQQGLAPSGDIYSRARELMNELQQRSEDQSRSDAELEYLERLLEQFD